MAPPTPPPVSPMDYFFAAPPFSRTITALTLAISIAVYTQTLSGYWILFHIPAFFKIPPQIWRLFTCFMLSGPQLSIIFDPYFLYVYGSQLEIASPRFPQPADFYSYLIFLWVTILGLNVIFTGASVFTSALILAFTYTACQDNRAGKATFIVVSLPATWIPPAMLFLTLVMAGPNEAKTQATGLVAAHLHDFLTRIYPTFGGGRNILETPAFVKRIFASVTPSVQNRGFGTSITPGQQPKGSSSGVSSGSVLPEAWKARGSGHRLGGD